MTKGNPVRNFFEIEAKAIFARYKAIEALIPKQKGKGAAHPAEEGRFVESLVRDFLNKHLPKELKALSGFILKPATKTGESNLQRVENEYDAYSPQIDIIVYDISKFPVYEAFEEFCIVPPEGVVAIISIKKNLRMLHIADELKALSKTVALCKENGVRPPYSCLYSFTSEFTDVGKSISLIFKRMKMEFSGNDFDFMINEISVLDSFMLFKFRKQHSDVKNNAKYVFIDTKNKGHVVLQRMLQSILGVYYKRMGIERPGYISFEKGTFLNSPPLGYIEYKKESIPDELTRK